MIKSRSNFPIFEDVTHQKRHKPLKNNHLPFGTPFATYTVLFENRATIKTRQTHLLHTTCQEVNTSKT
jgi:hypothetical protein